MAVLTEKSFYPKLLLRNYCLLSLLAGLMAARYIYPGLAVGGLVVLLSAAHGKRLAGALLLCLAFVLGFWFGEARAPERSPEPAWLVESMGGKNAYQRPQGLYVQGRVKDVESYADGRVRLLLSDVLPLREIPELRGQYARHTPALKHSLEAAKPYKGNVAVTLWPSEAVSLTMPLAGQTIRFNARFAHVRGFANPGVFTIDDYWHDREVWVRGWNVRGKFAVPLIISGEPDFFARLRYRLWRDFVQALPGMGEEDKGTFLDTPAPPTLPKTSQPSVGIAQNTADTLPLPTGLASLQGTGAVFLPALIFADRSGFTPYQKDLLAKATLTHSIALSGLHLGYVGLIGIALAFIIGNVFPTIFLYLPRPKLCFILTVPLALGYLWIGGAPLSLVRSAVMLFFFGLVLFGNRAQTLMDGLFAAVFLIVLLWPWALFDLSLQLSALSVGAIALFLPLIQRFTHALIPLSHERPGLSSLRNQRNQGNLSALNNPGSGRGGYGSFAKRKIRTGVVLLLMSLCIQLALAPLLVQTFGSLGLWFPLNLLWLPVLGLVVMPLTLGAFVFVGFGWEFGARLLLYGASLPCDALMWLLQHMDEAGYLAAPHTMRPHWLAILGVWIVAVFLPFLLWQKWQAMTNKERLPKSFYYAFMGCAGGVLLAIGVTALSWQRYAAQDVSLALLDVGQGQSIVLSWPGGRALVDGGGFSSKTFDVGKMVVAPYLTSQRPARVDWLINSHPDYDHLGGMMHILDSFSVTQGFAGNGDLMSEGLLKDYERIAANRPHLVQNFWQAGHRILLWDGKSKGEKNQKIGTTSLVPHQGNKLERQVFQDSEDGLVLEVLWPPKTPLASNVAPLEEPFSREMNRRGDGLALGGSTLTQSTLGARRGSDVGRTNFSGNDASLVLRLVWQGKGLALMCGDIGKKGLRGLLASTAPEALQAEVLILPHHGSKSSFSKKLYEAVSPATVLASCGYKNAWGFPHVDVRNSFENMGKPLYTTAEHGMVKVTWPEGAQGSLLELTRGR